MALLFHFLLVDVYVKILRMSNLESSQNNIKVSVLVLTYNQEKYVDDALQSVLHQRTDFSYEVVVGDATGTKDLSDSSKLGKKADPANVKPTEASTVEEIKAYLTAHKIDFSGKTTKNDLLALVK